MIILQREGFYNKIEPSFWKAAPDSPDKLELLAELYSFRFIRELANLTIPVCRAVCCSNKSQLTDERGLSGLLLPRSNQYS